MDYFSRMAQTATPLIRTGEAARRLGVDPSTLRRWATDGLIKAVRTPSGEYRFRPAEIDKALRDTA